MIFNNRIFKRCREAKPQPLRVNGTKTTLTPEPDDAEIAAQALLESLSGGWIAKDVRDRRDTAEKGVAYYRRLEERVLEGRAADRRSAARYVAYCEQELEHPRLDSGHTADLERGLYRHIDTVGREGGKLKERWQHCLAEVTVRRMGEQGGDGNKASTQSRHTEKEQHKNP